MHTNLFDNEQRIAGERRKKAGGGGGGREEELINYTTKG